MSAQLRILSLFLAILQFQQAYAADGYHYDRPTQSISSITHSVAHNAGHNFGALPTIRPLPAVPAIPPLPTGRPTSPIQMQTLIQTHPPPQNTYTSSKSIANAYRPPSYVQPQHSYLPPSAPAVIQHTSAPVFTSIPNHSAGIKIRYAEVAPEPQSKPGIFGQRLQPLQPFQPFQPLQSFQPLTPSAPAFLTEPYVPSVPTAPASAILSSTQADAQPLRIPYGKAAVVQFAPPTGPAGDIYELGGRQLKQYAVVEIIDNDIEQNSQPFLQTPFIDSYRAQIGASGTGATPNAPAGQQITSRANALVVEQQRLAQQQGAGGGGADAVALGSGGLGVVRLANGNVYLGSGSLGYISGQRHTALIQEARTRMGAPMPDALHFGHGPLGYPGGQGDVRRFRF